MKIKISSSFWVLALSLTTFIWACKKDPAKTDPPTQPPVTGLSDADSLKLLMYNIMQVSFVDGGRDKRNSLPLYLWYKQVPTLDPLSKEYDSAEVLLNKMKTYPKIGSKLLDKYSFLDDGGVSDEIQGGIAGDLGMELQFVRAGNGEIILIVMYADKNGPAGLAGVNRGYQITHVNDKPVVYDGSNGPNVQAIIQAVYYKPTATFTFKSQNGAILKTVLNRASYDINPVLFDTIYSVSGKKTGYFVFNTFANVYKQNGAPSFTKQKIDEAFQKFEGANIKNLIVDFRYNGGGSTATAEYLDSLIAPKSAAGKLMYQYVYNDKLTARASEVGLEEKIFFSGTGNLQLDNVFFITSGSTASASELTLNNLKPYMNVHVVGDTTFGKPTGFFGFPISIVKNGKEKHLADLYSVNFEMKNANNEGEYYDGIVPDALATDYVNVPWGNTNDENLDKIFHYISSGSFSRTSAFERLVRSKALMAPVQILENPHKFNGLVDFGASQKIQKHLKTIQ